AAPPSACVECGMWSGQYGVVPCPVSSSSLTDEGEDLKVLITPGQMLDYRPKVTRDNLVVIPKQTRKAAEEAIEIAANLIAVAQGCRRKIASPEPCVVFIAQGADGRKCLQERSGIHHKKLQSRIRAAEQLNL